jgi:Mrp family chromosome partitioning ATPase
MSALSPNDLRHYLTRRIASSDVEDIPPAPKAGHGKVGPVSKSFDAVLDRVLASATGGLPRALLVAGTSSKTDATHTAINLAHALVDRNEQVVLVDLAKGASTVSGPLGMPRVPGFAELASGRATFGDVIRVDEETPLQVITAGNPTIRGEDPEPDRFMRVFEALTQVYGCVVLHADLSAVEALLPALKFELPVMVAVLPARTHLDSEHEALSTFQALGCPVVVYEGNGNPRRMMGLFSRTAAV